MIDYTLEYITLIAFLSALRDVFFQAEDGIRDLVRSRGLGDVYKRQDAMTMPLYLPEAMTSLICLDCSPGLNCASNSVSAVSYTHLTLPTSDLV